MLHCMQRAMVMAVLLSLSMLVHAGQAPRPNIIFILADDYSIDNVGCYGAETFLQATPNLDRLATEGMRFSQVYCHPKCGPTRISLQTGQYPFRHGSLGVTDKAGVRSVKDERPLLAEILGSAGYVTGTFGKSERDGFDEYLDTGNGADYYREQLAHHTGTLDYAQPVYSQDEIMHYALDFIERHRAGPFYCYIPLNLPHVPFDPPPFLLHQVDFPWITADDTLDLAGYQAANPGKTVDDLRQAAVDAVAGEDVYGAMNTMIDSYVGDVLAKLQELDIDQNTLVLFAGDNGSLGQRSDVWDPQTASYRPIDGGKDNYGDCGGRVPFLLRWPATVAGGDVPTHLLDFTDLVPTFAELAGAKAPENIDGISVVPALIGSTAAGHEQKKHEFLYWEFHERGSIQAVRMGPWKGVRLAADKPLELYNLEKDIDESDNVAAEHPDIVEKMT
ncbi:MAG: sulfatase-like hydrolase/transferase, partial [Planctomycetota bacterium]